MGGRTQLSVNESHARTKLADRQCDLIEGSRKHVKAPHVSDTITSDYEFKVELGCQFDTKLGSRLHVEVDR